MKNTLEDGEKLKISGFGNFGRLKKGTDYFNGIQH
jgi:nucleoid DNA-binding protein